MLSSFIIPRKVQEFFMGKVLQTYKSFECVEEIKLKLFKNTDQNIWVVADNNSFKIGYNSKFIVNLFETNFYGILRKETSQTGIYGKI